MYIPWIGQFILKSGKIANVLVEHNRNALKFVSGFLIDTILLEHAEDLSFDEIEL